MKTKDFAIKLRALLPLFISTGIACGIWAASAPFLGLIGWAGFAGCTTYFSCGKHGVSGFVASALTEVCIKAVILKMPLMGLPTARNAQHFLKRYMTDNGIFRPLRSAVEKRGSLRIFVPPAESAGRLCGNSARKISKFI